MNTFFRVSRVLLVAGIVVLAAGSPQSARAQGEIVPKDLIIVIDYLSDIETLRAINPLNLTADQVGRMAAEVRKAETSHIKAVATAAEAFVAMAPEVKALRKRLLTGGEIPEDFDKRGAKIQTAFFAKREQIKNTTLKGLADAFRTILTPEQVKKVVEISKKLTKVDGKPTLQGSDDQFFNFWVKSVFIDYAGILPILDDVKKARDSAAADGGENQKQARLGTTVRKVARK